MFGKLLIANRGEIAVRVMRTAARMGIATVAVYSDADAQALHVAVADEAVRIGAAPASESYLNIDAVLAAAMATGAEAVHPGYGFLAENPQFAERCAAAGLVFVGPPAAAIRAMGHKDRAKALMDAAGVAVVPGYWGEDGAPARLAREAARIGYPVMIKPVAGGGGKGMRRVDAAKDFNSALEGAQREAKSAFGNDRVLIEKYVTRPRHIEVQVFADAHGHGIHLFERDCSLQRRHQKVIEEAPAPGMSAAIRKTIGAAAVKAARAVGYVGAGTVEFIADASDGLKADRIWFMEMNTRLQVEHPVTEAITGLDLVEWQLRVAAGEALPLTQPQIKARGAAIEARLYAEDPARDFLPSIGRLERLRLPDEADGIRVDAGVREGDAVMPYYDPLIAKLIAWEETRKGAAAKLVHALRETRIAGVRTNAAFLIRCLDNTDFLAGSIDTGFIARHRAALLPPAAATRPEIFAAAAAFILDEQPAEDGDPWAARDGFRLSGAAHDVVEFADGSRCISVERTIHRGGKVELCVDGVAIGEHPDVEVVRLGSGEIAVMENGETHLLTLYDPVVAADAAATATDRVVAPMSGRVVQVLIRPGETVARGQPLVVVEAMKMEHTLTAPAKAQVASVEATVGDQVTEGATLVRFAVEAPS